MKDKQPQSTFKRNAAGPERFNGANAEDDAELRLLLQAWRTAEISPLFDERVFASYRKVVQGIAETEETLPSFARVAQELSRRERVSAMKKCPNCKETFSDGFRFCPVDGVMLNAMKQANEPELQFEFEVREQETMHIPAMSVYHLTMIDDAGLLRRLIKELQATAQQSRLTWPEFKRDPFGFAERTTKAYGLAFRRFITAPNVAVAIVAAFVFMLSFVAAIAMLDRYRSNMLAQDRVRDDVELERMIDTNTSIEEENKDKGSPGNARGKGGGSGEEQKKPTGGGGGGNLDPKPPSHGKIPKVDLETPQIVPPMPEPPRLKKPDLPTPTTLNADPTLFPDDNRDMPYGDTKSKSTDPSAGPGENGGMGTGEDGGLGSGKGKGIGPGEGKNTGGGPYSGPGGGGQAGPGGNTDYTRIFNQKEVQQKAQITFKPQPEYTEDARKNQIQGVVRIQMVLQANGSVQSIHAVSSLPYGLTEKALEAAKRIQFVPAKKDGRNVSQWVTVEYNFRIY